MERELGTLDEMSKNISIERIVAEINSICTNTSCILVAIDGRGGSGKTTLARKLATLLTAQVIVGDDFYREMEESHRLTLSPKDGYEQYFDWQRLQMQVLEPLKAGRLASYQPYDWHTGEMAENPKEVSPQGIILIEGVYSLRPDLCSYYNYKIFVDVSRKTCLQRVQARSADSEEWIQRWGFAEDWYIQNSDPKQRANLIVPGDSKHL